MRPKGKHPSTGDLFQQPLAELINLKHPLVKLADLIDWSVFETRWAEFFPSCIGDTVGFLDHDHRQRSGQVVRLNDKTVTLNADGQKWRVAYALLHRVLSPS